MLIPFILLYVVYTLLCSRVLESGAHAFTPVHPLKQSIATYKKSETVIKKHKTTRASQRRQ